MTNAAPHRRLLVVDDDDATRRLLQVLLQSRGYDVAIARSGEEALGLLARRSFELVLLDLQLPGKSGIEVLTEAQSLNTDAEFVMVTAHGSIDTAVDAMKRGARDYLRKPLSTDELLLVVERIVNDSGKRHEIAALKRRATEGMRGRMIGRSAAMEQLWDRIERVAPTRSTVLITGETGVGKELVARAIHEWSPRSAHPFVATNCSALPETLLESELFGHVKGSFTGAVGSRKGLFEEASGGTLFLDEISTITRGIQITLLRVVQEREIQRIGSNTAIPIDLRLLAATNTDLAAEVSHGRFRADLYYRLNVVPIHVPPLRERREDIALLARHFLRQKAECAQLEEPPLPQETLREMEAYDWPGNVRELENFIEGAVIATTGGAPIRFRAPDSRPLSAERNTQPLLRHAQHSQWKLAELERERILQALAESGGHRGRSAKMLGIDRRTLYRKLKAYEQQEDKALGTV
jgi:DNA-binding NtrC family response regulator